MAEPLTSPISGGIRAVRNRVPANLLTGGITPQQQPVLDSVTPVLIQNNTLLLGNVVRQLSVVTNQIQGLQQGLEVVKDNLSLQIALDRQREAAERKRENDLAEEQLRTEGEKRIEKKIQQGLISPFARIAGKAQISLGAVGKFFSTLFFGWLAEKGIQAIRAASDGNKEKLKQIGLTVGGGLLTVGALWLSTRFGILKIIGSLFKINNVTKGFGLGKALLTPFRWLGNIFRGLNRFFLGKLPWIALGATLPGFGGSDDEGDFEFNDGGIVDSENLNNFKAENPNYNLGEKVEKQEVNIEGNQKSEVLESPIAEQKGFFGWLNNFYKNLPIWGDDIEPVEEEVKIIDSNGPGSSEEVEVINEEPITTIEEFKEKYNIKGVEEGSTNYNFGFNSSGSFDSSSITPIKKDQTLSQVINQEVDSGPTIIPIPLGGGNGNNPLDSSGKISGSSGIIPNIPAMNNSNTYVYTAYKHFNISSR